MSVWIDPKKIEDGYENVRKNGTKVGFFERMCLEEDLEAIKRNGRDSIMYENMGGRSIEIALSKGNFEMCKILLENGARSCGGMHLKGDGHYFFVELAYLTRRIDIMKLFIEHNSGFHRLLEFAVKAMDMETLTWLLESGAPVNGYNNFEWPDEKPWDKKPLQVACEIGDVDIVETLLDKGADPNLPNCDGFSATHLMCRAGNLELFKLLVSRGGNVISKWKPYYLFGKKAIPYKGDTSIIASAKSGNFEMCEYLISLIGNPFMPDEKECEFMWMRNCQHLIRAAIESENTKILELFLSLFLSLGKTIKQLMNDDDFYNNELLFSYAARRGNADICKVLIDHGASLYVEPLPLKIASENKNEKLCKLLIEHGAVADLYDVLKEPHVGKIEQIMDNLPKRERMRIIKRVVTDFNVGLAKTLFPYCKELTIKPSRESFWDRFWSDFDKFFVDVQKSGNVEMLEFLIENFPKKTSLLKPDHAAKSDNLEMVKLVCLLTKKDEKQINFVNAVCYSNSVIIAEHFLKNGLVTTEDLMKGFENACKKGHLKMALFLARQEYMPISIR